MKGELHIEEHPSDREGDAAEREETSGPAPRPLSFWRSYLADHGGCVPGAGDEVVPVDLSAWDDRPDDTLLSVFVRWVDPDLVGTVDPDPPAWLRR